MKISREDAGDLLFLLAGLLVICIAAYLARWS